MSDVFDHSGLHALTMDGGGINTLGTLVTVSEFMRAIQAVKKLSHVPRPYAWFHLIVGTGTGGLAAILLGKLKLTADEAIACYVEILRRAFKKKIFPSNRAFSATQLELVMGEIVARHCGRADARMIDDQDQDGGCKVMVCAMSADAIRGSIPTCIRTYQVAAHQGPDCTIVEAVRATTATPGMFKPAWIEENHVRQAYVGGGLGCNNPAAQALSELESVFPGRPLSTFFSIGSGQLHSAHMPARSRLLSLFPCSLYEVVQSIATDCERTNQELSGRFSLADNVYFRFNTEQGIQDIDQSDAARLSEVQAHTRNYLRGASVSSRMQDAAEAIVTGAKAVKILKGNVQSLKESRLRIGRCPPPSGNFTGRQAILDQIRAYFFDDSSAGRHLFVLCGLGGSGKTQLALKFVDLHKDQFWDIFYIDATSRETVSAGLIALAKESKAGETHEAALAWLVSRKERWLLVLNDADDPELNLQKFFPACTHGDILITTRNQEMRVHTQGAKSFCPVSGMLPDDAQALLLKASGAEEEQGAVESANTLVTLLGFFALAIIQSGAFVRATQCGLAEYLKLLQKSREQFLRERRLTQADDFEHSVYTSWDLSYQKLDPRATQLLHIISFLHHEGISETIFEVASTGAVSFEPIIPLTESQRNMKYIAFEFLSSLRTSSGEWDSLALMGLTSSLRAFSLLDYDAHSRTYSMHPLVQEWCRTMANIAAGVRESAAWLLALCVNWKFDSDSYAFRRRLLPHLLALSLDHNQIAPELANRLCLIYREAGYVAEEVALATITLQASRDMLGNEHPTTLTQMYTLGGALHNQGKLEEAVTLLTEGIEVQKQVLGQEHPNTLKSMHNLACVYRDQERWQEAEELYLKVIEIENRVIGAEHESTLPSIGELASTYWSQGRLSEAEGLQVEVLEIMQRVLGSEHPDTLVSMHNLASTYEAQGKLREAKLLMEEKVALGKQVLGESHSNTQQSIKDLERIHRRLQSELAVASV